MPDLSGLTSALDGLEGAVHSLLAALSPPVGTPVPASIDATGATDVTDALNAFIAAQPAGSTIVFAAGATYRGRLNLANLSGITIEGNGATVHYPGADWSVLRFTTCDHLTLRNLTASSNMPYGGTPQALTGEGDCPGIRLRGCTHVVIDGCHTRDVWGDGIFLTNGGAYEIHCDDVLITGCLLERDNRNGIAVDNGNDVRIVGNTFRDCGMHAVDVELMCSTQEIGTNVRIEGNTVESYGRTNQLVSFFVAATTSGPAAGAPLGNLTVVNNIVVGNDAGYDGKPLGLHILVDPALLRDGHTQGEVARLLGISYQTVKNHMTDGYARLGIPLGTPRGGALMAALQVTGLMTPGDGSVYRAEARVAQATAAVAAIKAELAKLGRLLIAMAEES